MGIDDLAKDNASKAQIATLYPNILNMYSSSTFTQRRAQKHAYSSLFLSASARTCASYPFVSSINAPLSTLGPAGPLEGLDPFENKAPRDKREKVSKLRPFR